MPAKKASKKKSDKKTVGKKASKKKSAASSKRSKKAATSGAAKASKTSKTSKASKASSIALTTTETLTGNCIDLATAGFIVRSAIGSGNFDIDRTLEEMGLISPDLRKDFRLRVLRDIRETFGCTIEDSAVPNGANDTARVIRDTIQARAGR